MDPNGNARSNMAMVNPTRIVFLVLAVPIFASCSTLSSLARYSPQELERPIELARRRALAEPGLDTHSQQMIANTRPRISYYKLAADFAQYGFTWKISNNRTIVVFGEGDIQRLDGAKVSIKTTR